MDVRLGTTLYTSMFEHLCIATTYVFLLCSNYWRARVAPHICITLITLALEQTHRIHGHTEIISHTFAITVEIRTHPALGAKQLAGAREWDAPTSTLSILLIFKLCDQHRPRERERDRDKLTACSLSFCFFFCESDML